MPVKFHIPSTITSEMVGLNFEGSNITFVDLKIYLKIEDANEPSDRTDPSE